MIRQMKAVYRRQMFFPGWLGVFVNPFFFARAGLRDTMLEFSPKLCGRLLDVGCGSKPYQSLFAVDEYVGLDIDNEATRLSGSADQLYDGNTFPFFDNAFDSILCNQVLEHVFNPEEFLGEVSRVLRVGGHLVLTVPFVWDEHEQPFDYARYSSYGLRSLLEKKGFKIIQQKKIGADPSVIFQLANMYIFKVTRRLPNIFKILIAVSVLPFVNLTGLFARWCLPGNPDLYLDNAVLAEKIF